MNSFFTFMHLAFLQSDLRCSTAQTHDLCAANATQRNKTHEMADCISKFEIRRKFGRFIGRPAHKHTLDVS